MRTFKLEILSPREPIFAGEAGMIIPPGKEGELAIMAGHAPLLAALEKGKLEVRLPGEIKTFKIKSGFVEVNENGVTVLVKSENPDQNKADPGRQA